MAPVLDLFGGPTLLWCNVDELREKVEAGGFVAISPDGYVLGYGRRAGSALAGKVWSGWRRKAEEEARLRAEAEAEGGNENG